MQQVPLGLSEAEAAAKAGEASLLIAVYANLPRPVLGAVDDLARFAVLAAYGPDDATVQVQTRPDKAAICFSLDGGPWQIARLANPYGDEFGELRVVRDGSLRAPAVAIPAGEHSTRGAIMLERGSALAPFCLTTCGVGPSGKLLHRIDAPLTESDMLELGLENIPVAVLDRL